MSTNDLNAPRNLTVSGYKWELKLSLMPRRCCLTKEKLPIFEKAYRGWYIINGPGEDMLVVDWMSLGAYVVEKLKGNV